MFSKYVQIYSLEFYFSACFGLAGKFVPEKLRESKQPAKFIRRQPGAFGNRTHGDRIDGIVAGNDEPLLAVGHHDMSALPGDAIAELFKNTDGVALADARNFWHNSNGDEFAGEASAFGCGLVPRVFLGDFEPELDGFADVGECFIMRRSLTMATRQRGA